MADELKNDVDRDLDRLKTLIGVDLDENDEARVKIYIQQAKQAIMVYVGQYVEGDEFPQDLNYLVDQLTLDKYNKFHNEGMNSISEEGLSISWNANDLKEYLPDLQAWIDRNSNGQSMLGNAISW